MEGSPVLEVVDSLDAEDAIRASEPLPDALPVLPLRETVTFPETLTPLAVGQERSIKLVNDVLAGNRMLAMVASREPETVERLRALLSPFGGDMRTFSNPAEAEFVKCAHNIFNAAKISFWNEMWLVAQAYGIDADPVASTVAASSEGSINPLYGIRGGAPYGGVCLPKDTCGFLGFASTIGVDMPLLRAVVEVNDRMEALTGQELDSVVERDMSGADVA